MHFEIYSRFLQIVIKEDCKFIEKILTHAKKYFCQIHYLSNTLLILDDSKPLKKRYFLNWLFHLQEVPINQAFLDRATHLPIRLKIVALENLLYRIDAKVRIVDFNRVKIILSKDDLKAKRCILRLFDACVCDSDRLLLDSSKEGFWEYLLGIVHSRIVNNLVLYLDFQSDSCLSQKGMRLEQDYKILDSCVGENLSAVRKKYISLVKKYHPDNVFGADSEIIQEYQRRFIQIQNAFDNICASLNC